MILEKQFSPQRFQFTGMTAAAYLGNLAADLGWLDQINALH